MNIRALICVVGLVSSHACADPVRLAQAQSIVAIPPSEVVVILRSAGFIPITAPSRAGTAYTLRAVDRYGTPVRVVVDARYGDIMSVRRVTAADPMRSPNLVPGVRRPDLLGPPPFDPDDDGLGAPTPRHANPGRLPAPGAMGTPPHPPVAKSKPATPPATAGRAAATPATEQGQLPDRSPRVDYRPLVGTRPATSTGTALESGQASVPPPGPGRAEEAPHPGAFPPVTPLQ